MGCARPQVSMVAWGLAGDSAAAEARSIGVSTEPGKIALTRMPSAAWSFDMPFTSASVAALLAAYSATEVWQTRACTEDVQTMAPPPRRRISGMAYLHIQTWPRKLTARLRS